MMAVSEYSENLHSVISSLGIAFTESGLTKRDLLTPGDVFRIMSEFDEDAISALEMIFSLDLRPLVSPETPVWRANVFDPSRVPNLPEISFPSVDSEARAPFWDSHAWLAFPLHGYSVPHVHFSPLGSPDYILDFRAEQSATGSFVYLDVWSARYRWVSLFENQITKGKLIASVIVNPRLGSPATSRKKPWLFKSLDFDVLDFATTHAIQASQHYKICDTCNQLKSKLSYSGSSSCDHCLGIIH
jgi:hypothetical protein